MLETKRLILRKWMVEDADSLFEYAKDEFKLKYSHSQVVSFLFGWMFLRNYT